MDLDYTFYELHGYANAHGYVLDNRVRNLNAFLSGNLFPGKDR